jgi:signal transduction histidine kinase
LVDGDPEGLRQVLLNLLDNAVKHNHAGGWVRIGLQAKPGQAVLTIDNSGPAISPEIAPQLFGRFVRGTGPTAGSGLGLSIAKMIVEAHGGHIDCAAPDNLTVRFSVRLPLVNTDSLR